MMVVMLVTLMVVTFVVMVVVRSRGRESFFGRGILLDCVSGGQWICLPEFVGED